MSEERVNGDDVVDLTAAGLEAGSAALAAERARQLRTQGYLVLRSFLPEGLSTQLRVEADRWVDDGLRARSIASSLDPVEHGLPPVLEVELEAHGQVIVCEPLLEILERALGPGFGFHHIHSDRQSPSLAGKPWHHDYEQEPAWRRDHPMVHAFHYIDGLDQGTASLVLLPGSERRGDPKRAMAHLGTQVLPGEVLIDDLPQGSTVVIHSAMFHARRPPAQPGTRPRYMVDVSYCADGGRWPSAKPYWRQVLRTARARRLDSGHWPGLFSEHHFEAHPVEIDI